MNILEIIEKKREKQELTNDEIKYFVDAYVNEQIADYQAAALVMAIFLNGMSKRETTDLTLAMAHSGEILDLKSLNKIIVDKHSTGGVGDKVSICLLPLVASLGVPVAKMSGRGLGFTGGTVDKLESIPGYKTNIDINNFIKNVENIGISMISQTLNLAPADKKLYALRDSISCVESIPLIASSIMSKKIASGAEKIVLDVTVGSGAFMKNIKQAEELANEMMFGKEVPVTIRFRNGCIQDVLEVFGADIPIIPIDDKHFKIVIMSQICPEAFTNLLDIGCYGKVIAPPNAVEEMKRCIHHH